MKASILNTCRDTLTHQEKAFAPMPAADVSVDEREFVEDRESARERQREREREKASQSVAAPTAAAATPTTTSKAAAPTPTCTADVITGAPTAAAPNPAPSTAVSFSLEDAADVTLGTVSSASRASLATARPSISERRGNGKREEDTRGVKALASAPSTANSSEPKTADSPEPKTADKSEAAGTGAGAPDLMITSAGADAAASDSGTMVSPRLASASQKEKTAVAPRPKRTPTKVYSAPPVAKTRGSTEVKQADGSAALFPEATVAAATAPAPVSPQTMSPVGACVCVCVCVCRVCVCVCARRSEWTREEDVCVCTCVCVCVYTCMYVCMHVWYMYICICVYMF